MTPRRLLSVEKTCHVTGLCPAPLVCVVDLPPPGAHSVVNLALPVGAVSGPTDWDGGQTPPVCVFKVGVGHTSWCDGSNPNPICGITALRTGRLVLRHCVQD